MSAHQNSASSLREAFAAFRTQRALRAQRREIALLFADPDLSPSARQEMATIVLRANSERAAQIAVPAQRSGAQRSSKPGLRVLQGAAGSR
ncbi:hypothetical protein MXD61_23290 [Frankia sp. AgPm24]|uniref:hypothetical protein n=1 Tax=Frankia sp. AgPm24 TaxID=631128 RepID=UPI00200E0357|nr:hypothetical protein [Frankia sp. AgPm24]MCK9924753.1 hypothetical protein [Frankia sp. AgPm24]